MFDDMQPGTFKYQIGLITEKPLLIQRRKQKYGQHAQFLSKNMIIHILLFDTFDQFYFEKKKPARKMQKFLNNDQRRGALNFEIINKNQKLGP